MGQQFGALILVLAATNIVALVMLISDGQTREDLRRLLDFLKRHIK